MQIVWHSPIHCTFSLIAPMQLQIQLSSAGSSECVGHNVLSVQLPQAALPWVVYAQATSFLVTPNVPKPKHKRRVSTTHCESHFKFGMPA